MGTGRVRAAGGRFGLARVADGRGGSRGPGVRGDRGNREMRAVGPRGAPGRGRRWGFACRNSEAGCAQRLSPRASPFSSVAPHREPGPLLLSHILSQGGVEAGCPPHRLGHQRWCTHCVWCKLEPEDTTAPEELGDGRTTMVMGCCHLKLRGQTGSLGFFGRMIVVVSCSYN